MDYFDNQQHQTSMLDDIEKENHVAIETDIDKREKTAEEADFRTCIMLQNNFRDKECDDTHYINKIDALLRNTPSVELRSIIETDNFNATDTIIAMWFGIDYSDFPNATSVFRFLLSLAYIIEPEWNNGKNRSNNQFYISIGNHTPYDQSKDFQQVTLHELNIINKVMTGRVPELQVIDIQRLHTLVCLFIVDEQRRAFTMNEVLDFDLDKHLINSLLWHADFTIETQEPSFTVELFGNDASRFRGFTHEASQLITPLSNEQFSLIEQRTIVPKDFITDTGMRVYIDALSERWLSADKEPDWNQQISRSLDSLVCDYIRSGHMRFRGYAVELKPVDNFGFRLAFPKRKNSTAYLKVLIVYVGFIEYTGRLYDVCLWKPLFTTPSNL